MAEKGGHFNALGRSRGGFSTKIHVVGDADGLPLALHLTPGQTADIASAEDARELVEAHPKALLADKGYDSDVLRHFRRLATRTDKTAARFLSFVQLAAIHKWTRFVQTA